MNKFDHIDWAATVVQFGYADKKQVRPKDCVVSPCGDCGKPVIKTLRSIREQPNRGPYFTRCRDCFLANQSTKQKAVWARNGYRENAAQKATENSLKLWQDDRFRAKVIAGVAKAHATIDGYTNAAVAALHSNEHLRRFNLDKRRRDFGYRQKISAAGKANWRLPEFREMMATAHAPFHTDEWRRKLSESNRAYFDAHPEYRQQISDRVRQCWQDPEFAAKIAVARASQPRISGLQTKLYGYLDELGVPYHIEGPKTRIGRYVFDCMVMLPNEQILLECQGKYWHSLPGSPEADARKLHYVTTYRPDLRVEYIHEHEYVDEPQLLERLRDLFCLLTVQDTL